MLFRTYVPHPLLCDFIEDFWLYEDYEGDHQREQILPSGTFEIVFNLHEDEFRIYDSPNGDDCRRFSGALVSGPYSGPFTSDTSEESAILGIHFRPGGAFAVLGLPAQELMNSHVDLRTIWGPAATTLRERLCELREPAERFRLLERALVARLVDPPARHGAVRPGLDAIVRSCGQAKVRDVARDVDLSERRFISVFAAEVGLTPKLFARVQRFQHALASSRNAPEPDWAQLAIACGYFDQSHLIRECVEFSGVTPGDYRRRRDLLDRAGFHVKRHHLPVTT